MKMNFRLIQVMLCLLMVSWIIPVSCTDWDIDSKKWADANNYFGCKLYHKLEKDSRGNLFFSPLSLSVAFGMLFHGARGHTSKEMQKVLGYEESGLPDRNAVSSTINTFLKKVTSAEYELNIANKILLKESLDEDTSYTQDMRTYYQTEIDRVDITTDSGSIPQKVNSWVETHTKGKIRHLINQIDPSTVMMFLNAVYFKGQWKSPFHEASVKPFYNGGYHESPVIMMNQETEFPYASFPTYQAVQLPYNGDASMLILLPNQRDGLTTLESTLCSPDLLSTSLSGLKNTNVNLTLPKFSLSYSASLEEPLQSLGMQKVFEYGADLSGISRSEDMQLSMVVHKATVSVDEKGTVATAATMGGIRLKSAYLPQKPVDFNVDHPFVFAIVEKVTRMVMFLGRVNSL